MKKLVFALVIAFAGVIQCAAQHDTAMTNRLNAVLKYTRELNMEKVMDYTYPKLFTIATREQLLEALKSAFDTDEFSTTLDSVNLIKIFPAFTINNESYAKIKHSMVMRMKFKEPVDSSGTGDRVFMATMMEQQFGEGNVRYDSTGDAIVIAVISDLVAIKRKEDHLWYFVNFDEEDKMVLNLLFSKEVLDKLKEYK
jgi:hypothetical protein